MHKLETTLKPLLARAPHSVIGSSCLGASIVGGVANNSGGALVKRGPAYTELALFAQVTAEGKLELVNHLDIELGDTPQEILTNLESSNFDHTTTASDKRASATDYTERLRDVDADTQAALTPIPADFTRPVAVPANWQYLPSDWTLLKSPNRKKPSISAPITPIP